MLKHITQSVLLNINHTIKKIFIYFPDLNINMTIKDAELCQNVGTVNRDKSTIRKYIRRQTEKYHSR